MIDRIRINGTGQPDQPSDADQHPNPIRKLRILVPPYDPAEVITIAELARACSVQIEA